MRTLSFAAALTLLAAPVSAQACFDPAQCARDALMRASALERQISILATEMRAMRADRGELAAEIRGLRRAVNELGDRVEVLEDENEALREALGDRLPQDRGDNQANHP
ncbi:hypothetical protein ATO6_11950 [Oceanicola sp. 22II-s10i]|uniref:hypothetical protein n=1 Tax=Oceanicola sp. 22II-s10i TaxID=1317116 RepID=UPI000B67D1E0|nr:hypothetical protein [Oceanicola sp. 22II-s10i]OWU84415.1 hypothetical protein ATO6_11950 [Oceanicola sp. 22II-s10i]